MSIKSKTVSNALQALFSFKQQEHIFIGDFLMSGLHRYYKIWNNLFKPIDALNCIGGDKCNKMFYGECRIYQFLLPLKMLSFCAVPTIYNRILQRLLLKALLRLDIVLKNNTITLIFLFAGYSLVMNVNKFFFIDQDTYWT